MKTENIIVSVTVIAIIIAIALSMRSGPGFGPVTTLKQFSSYDELTNFVKASSSFGYGFGVERALSSAEIAPATAASAKSEDYSTTNIQVQGVDESDIVKNDGKYIYVVSGNSIEIINAYPASEMEKISEINLSGSINGIFINDNKLVVFWQEYYSYPRPVPLLEKTASIMPPYYYQPKSFITIYDISDREEPAEENNISIRGNYFNSRMIGDYVYAIVTQPVYNYGDGDIIMPEISVGDVVKEVKANEVYYFDIYDSSYSFSTVAAINIKQGEVETKTFLMGYAQSMFVSQENIYITYAKQLGTKYYYNRLIELYLSLVSEKVADKIKEIRDSDDNIYEKMQKIGKIVNDYAETLSSEELFKFQNDFQDELEKLNKEIAEETDKTVIHKISINKEKIEEKAVGEVRGHVLNQFSMDEYKKNFRIATTTNEWNWRTEQKSENENNLYVLDESLEVVGKIEGLAEGERIYSARFLQDRAYMVTFRQIDPLFVIDLENAENPKVLGFLKIPGVSDYLHPYDETHIIGVGRDATEEGRVLGLKLSLFDISDFSSPKEISKYIIGGRGTYSDALYDHKAFLFSKQKNLLVIPATVYEHIEGQEEWQSEYKGSGAYVFSLTLEEGFQLKGIVSHEEENKTYQDWNAGVKRSLYIDDVLYTVSGKMVKANNLDDLSEISNVMLNKEEIYYITEGFI